MPTVDTQKQAANVTEQPRKLPLIDPTMCRVNNSGEVFKELFVRLGDNFRLDDLKEPSIWSRVQASRTKALRRFDRVVLTTFDEGKLIIAYVADATADSASLSKPQVVELVSRMPSQYGDDKHFVSWGGNGYSVIRRADKHVMAEGFANQAAAIAALNGLYPRAV